MSLVRAQLGEPSNQLVTITRATIYKVVLRKCYRLSDVRKLFLGPREIADDFHKVCAHNYVTRDGVMQSREAFQ